MDSSPIITLTSDLGDADVYVAALKARLLSACPQANLIDITHKVPAFNILEAAFVLKNVYQKFPPGTIHLVAVDPDGGSKQPGIVMKLNDHYFVGPDNGIFSLIKEEDGVECVSIDNPDLLGNGAAKSFMAQNSYVPAAVFLANGGILEKVGDQHDMREYLWGEPTYSENALRGIIIHIDHFGNAITNIRKDEFLKIKGDRSFQIFVRNLRLQRIVSTYSDVAKGEALALFGESGHLEIAIREGSSKQLLGLNSHDMLTIEFYG